MAMKLINESSLVAIGNAIRAKNGSSDTYTPAEMVTAIGNISGGGEPVEVLPSKLTTFNNVRGDYLFTSQVGKILLRNYLDELSFTNMQDMPYAFAEMGNNGDYVGNGLLSYPTDLSSLHIYFKDNTGSSGYDGYISLNYMFNQAHYIQYLPKFHFTNTGAYDCSYMFYGSKSILNIDDFMNSLIFLNTSQSKSQSMFQNSSLKNIPHLEKLMYGGQITGSYSNNTIYSQGFSYCYELQQLLNLPVFNPTDSTKNNTGNIFYNSFNNCSTLSRLVFNTDNGTPIVARWSNQSINLGTSTNKMYIGYFQRISNVLDSNIPVVTDQTTYEQYKNGVYHTALVEYSRYNHDSAVETINSLPDTSAVSNGTNKILFLGASGSATDSGAISNLTSAEIQVATDKGWTVNIT